MTIVHDDIKEQSIHEYQIIPDRLSSEPDLYLKFVLRHIVGITVDDERLSEREIAQILVEEAQRLVPEGEL